MPQEGESWIKLVFSLYRVRGRKDKGKEDIALGNARSVFSGR
jgi:hypothetical protein